MKKITNLGFLGAIFGITIACSSFLYVYFALRGNPEYSTEMVLVPPNGELLIEIESQDGRYEYQVRSDQYIDAYLLPDGGIDQYKAGLEFPISGSAEHTRAWSTFIQTGVGLDFALLLIDGGESEANVSINLTFFPDPNLGLFYILIGTGVLVFIGGIAAVVIGFVKKTGKALNESGEGE
jgi:hypothetical protein